MFVFLAICCLFSSFEMAQATSCEFPEIYNCAEKLVELKELLWTRNPSNVARWFKQTAMLCEEAEGCFESLGKCPQHADKVMQVTIRCVNQQFSAQDDFIDCSILLKGKRSPCAHIPLATSLENACSTWQKVGECESEHIAEVCGIEYVSVFKKHYDAQAAEMGC